MHKLESSNMDYSQLSDGEIQSIKETEEKINQTRAEGIILLAVEPKE